MVYTIDILVNKIIASEKQYDLDKITAAYELANEAHKGQMRSSGEPYISHPVAVAYILLEFCMDTDTIVAALLHDVVEDTYVSLDTIQKMFGVDVANLVDGVTKIGMVNLNTKEEQHAENIRKILIAMSKDLRVIIIKLADRVHNMRTLGFRTPEKQRATAVETMSFFAPIAHRLGINDVKEEMEDLSLRYLDPYGFREIEDMLDLHKEERNSFIDSIRDKISQRISDIVPTPKIEGRVKSIYSIYKKVYVKGKSFDEIYDIYAVRIIVQSVIECYNVLGIIHDMFKPIPYRFKDYIATPKPNRYQSLHTTVIGREGIPFEVQIRTQEMHNTAQYGVAAHWKYKAGINSKAIGEKRFDWIRQILEQQQEADDVEQITEAIKVDLAPDDVYVFTPKGDVITLPVGSTIVDFAYAIHTEVGNKMTGAKVASRMTSFDYVLKTGDIVEILTTTSEKYSPNRNWLNIAKTNEAKAKIRGWFKRECHDENVLQGKEQLEREFKRNLIPWKADFVLEISNKQHFITAEDFYAAIGYGGVILSKIMQRVKSDYQKSQKLPDDDLELIQSEALTQRASKGVIVEGIDNCAVRYSQCCNPLPGDEIVGFITRGYGVSIHKKDCENVLASINTPQNKERFIRVTWAGGLASSYRATLDIITENRDGLIADITVAIAQSHIPIEDITTHHLKNSNVSLIITVEIEGVEQLNTLITRLRKISGIISVERTGKS